ncbi:MAG TPA: patatin-like phospholipase family protein [Humisphaera sp.]
MRHHANPRVVRVATLALSVVLVAAFAGGCGGSPRTGVTTADLEAGKAAYDERVKNEYEDSVLKLVHRLKRKHDDFAAGRTTVPPTCDVLVLSGGADYGAFGAGVLEGWGRVRDPAMARPEFDLVSGVSTGALIAPFALVGDENAYDRAFRLYQQPKEGWIHSRGLLFFLPGNESLMDVSLLREDIAREINYDVVRRVAEASRNGRLLRISATNLDYGRRRVWDLGVEAERAAADPKHDLTRFHKVLQASSAIPGAFPPVEIDGHVYVDGATTSNILYEDNMRSPHARVETWRHLYPGVPVPKLRYWVIINNQFESPPEVTERTWVSAVERSLGTSVRASTMTAVQHLAAQLALLRLTSGVETEFRVISIPNEWRPPKPGIFVKETMVSLAKLGFEMGKDPASWREGALLNDTPPVMPRASTRPATTPATGPAAVPASAPAVPAAR